MKIIKLRTNSGITQAELAKRCDTTQQQIAKIEKGIVDPKLSTIRRIADALDTEIGNLFLSRKEFLQEVRSAIADNKLKLKGMSPMRLNSLCAREKRIGSFHPYWELLEIKNNSVHLKEK